MTHYDDGVRHKLFVSTAGDFVSLGNRTDYPFEAGGAGIPAGWTLWVEAGAASDVNFTTAYGRWSVSNASTTDAHNGGRYTIYRDFPVTAGHRYLIRVQAQTMEGKTSAYRSFTIQGNVNLTRYGSSMRTQQSWEQISHTFTPAGDTSFRIYLQANPYWGTVAAQTFDWGVQFQNVAVIDQLASYPDPTWHEITCDSLSYTSRYGRSKFTSRYDVASCQITINNNDGEFTFNPYHEWGLRPGRFVKIVTVLPGSTWENPMFYGLIDSMTDAYALTGKAGVVMQCVDTSTLLSNQTVPSINSESTTYYSGGRFKFLYGSAGWLPQMANTEPGIFIQQPITANGRTVRDELGLIADSEGGWFFCDRNGVLQYRDREAVPRYFSWNTVLAELLAECPDYMNRVKLVLPGIASHYGYINHQSSFDLTTAVDMVALVTMPEIAPDRTGGYLSVGTVTTPDTADMAITGKVRLSWGGRITSMGTGFPWLLNKTGTTRELMVYLYAPSTFQAFSTNGVSTANVDVGVPTGTLNVDHTWGIEFTPGSTAYTTIIDGTRANMVAGAPMMATHTNAAVQLSGNITGAVTRVYWMQLEKLDAQGNPSGVIWRFDANDYPGTGTTYIDPRGRTWTLSAASAITPGTITTPAQTFFYKGVWYFRKAPNGKRLDAFLGGALVTSTEDLPYANGDTFWVRVQRDTSNNVRFYHKVGSAGATGIPTVGSMVQLGTTLTATGSMGLTTTPLQIGGAGATGQSWPLNARVHRWTLIASPNGSILADLVPSQLDGYEGATLVPLNNPAGMTMNLVQSVGHELLVVDPDREPGRLYPVDSIPTSTIATIVELQQLQTDWARDRVVNDIQLANQGGSAFQFVDAESQKKYGPRTYQRMDLLNVNTTPEYLITRSHDIMDGYTDAVLRVNSVQFRPNMDTYNWVVQAFLQDLVRIRYTNSKHGWGFSVVSHIQQVEHAVTPHDWVCTLLVDDPEAFNRWDADESGTGWDEGIWDETLWDGFSVGQWNRDSQWNDGKSVWK